MSCTFGNGIGSCCMAIKDKQIKIYLLVQELVTALLSLRSGILQTRGHCVGQCHATRMVSRFSRCPPVVSTPSNERVWNQSHCLEGGLIFLETALPFPYLVLGKLNCFHSAGLHQSLKPISDGATNTVRPWQICTPEHIALSTPLANIHLFIHMS